MKLITLLLLTFTMFGFSNCSSIEYESDIGFMSAQAGDALELAVQINGKDCKDISGSFGACSLAVSERRSLDFKMPLTSYSYELSLTCSSNVNIEKRYSVTPNKRFEFAIMPSEYQSQSSFTCIGRMTPDDRNFVSNTFEVRVRVYDRNYVSRNDVYVVEHKDKYYLNFGKHAYSVWVHDGEEWKHYSESPLVRIRKRASNYKAYSESETMRFNYYNL